MVSHGAGFRSSTVWLEVVNGNFVLGPRLVKTHAPSVPKIERSTVNEDWGTVGLFRFESQRDFVKMHEIGMTPEHPIELLLGLC